MLVYPERGLVLNETAARITALCDGRHSIDAIIDAFAPDGRAQRTVVERDVCAFLEALAQRRLLTWTCR
jgi:pyrroloquinoline quinone biosynthesis protein D